MHLADAGGGGRGVVEVGEALPPGPAELLGQYPVHGAGRHRGCRGLQLGQRLPVWLGDLVRNGRLEDRQRLAELHGAALELTEHREDLLGGTGGDVGLDLLGAAAGQPLAPTSSYPAGGAERQAGELRGTCRGAAGEVLCHEPDSGRKTGSYKACRGSPLCACSGSPLRAAPHPQAGCGGRIRLASRPVSGSRSTLASTVTGSPDPASSPRTCSTAMPAATAVAVWLAAAGRPASCAASRGQHGSQSLRCRLAQRRQLVRPGSTNGPTPARPSSTCTARCGTRSATSHIASVASCTAEAAAVSRGWPTSCPPYPMPTSARVTWPAGRASARPMPLAASSMATAIATRPLPYTSTVAPDRCASNSPPVCPERRIHASMSAVSSAGIGSVPSASSISPAVARSASSPVASAALAPAVTASATSCCAVR